MSKHRHVVLGAGISGLTLTWNLKKRYPQDEILLLEKTDRTGGWIRTDRSTGYLFETGPRSLRPHLATLNLIQELGLQNEIILGGPSARYLYYRKKLQKVPTNPLLFPFSQITRPAIPGMIRELFVPPGKQEETIHDFFARRFNKHTAEVLANAMTTGIYAADSHNLSLRCCFPTLYEWEQKHGSVIRGAFKHKREKPKTPWMQKVFKEPLYTFKGGMQTLTDALTKQVKSSLRLFSESTFDAIDADQIYSTLPIESIPKTSVTTVNLGYENNVLSKEGFGYLIPACEGEDILGVVWDSSAFPEQNQGDETRLTVMLAGAPAESLAIAKGALKRHMGITAEPVAHLVTHAKKAIPHYALDHHKRIEEIRKQWPHVVLLGTAFNGVSVNDCIEHALNGH